MPELWRLTRTDHARRVYEALKRAGITATRMYEYSPLETSRRSVEHWGYRRSRCAATMTPAATSGGTTPAICGRAYSVSTIDATAGGGAVC